MGSSTDSIYAHSLPGEPPDKWETLDTHATAVANLAREFATAFQAADWGELLGQWHDLGKSSAAFQNYLHQSQNPADAGRALRCDRSNLLINKTNFEPGKQHPYIHFYSKEGGKIGHKAKPIDISSTFKEWQRPRR